MNVYPAGLGCQIKTVGSQVVYRYYDGHKTFEFGCLVDVPRAFQEQFREAIWYALRLLTGKERTRYDHRK